MFMYTNVKLCRDRTHDLLRSKKVFSQGRRRVVATFILVCVEDFLKEVFNLIIIPLSQKQTYHVVHIL
jgi:hypothetical protein